MAWTKYESSNGEPGAELMRYKSSAVRSGLEAQVDTEKVA